MRYVKGGPKGCKVCHRERQREQPYDAARSRTYAQTHRAEINARIRAWRAVNRPDVVEFRNGDALAVEYAQIIEGDPCVYCGSAGTEKDHIVPVSRGGVGEWLNLAPACRTCNASKQTTDVLQFMLKRLALAA
jgi:5-methylcytosine-specific restriction endonuclease McrA